jgi:hypothetical protein
VTADGRARVLALLRDGLAEEVPAALAEQQRRERRAVLAEASTGGHDDCQIGSTWITRDIGWLADGDIAADDLHGWRIYLGGGDMTGSTQACAYRLINENRPGYPSLANAPNGLPVIVRVDASACDCERWADR